MSLMAKLKKNSTIKVASAMDKSEFFNREDKVYDTGYPLLNLMHSGKLRGQGAGFRAGVTIISALPKNFKTQMLLQAMATYLKAEPEAVGVYMENEFGSPVEYFESMGIDPSRVFHVPVMHCKELQNEMHNIIESLEDKEKIFMAIDSLGNLPGSQEHEKSTKGKKYVDTGDRAKELRSLWRTVTPYIKMKGIPLFAIGHVYANQEMFSQDSVVISGGSGHQYACNTSVIMSKYKQKNEDTEEKSVLAREGNEFRITVEMSRFVRDGLKLPLRVSFEHGILPYTGLIEIAQAFKYPKIREGKVKYDGKTFNGYAFEKADGTEITTPKKLVDTDSDFWETILNESNDFCSFVEGKVSYKKLDKDDEVELDTIKKHDGEEDSIPTT